MAQFCAFWWHLLSHFGTLCHFLAFFLHYFGLFGLSHCFVANQICRNLCTFGGKIFLLKPCWCKKKIFLHVVQGRYKHAHRFNSIFYEGFSSCMAVYIKPSQPWLKYRSISINWDYIISNDDQLRSDIYVKQYLHYIQDLSTQVQF